MMKNQILLLALTTALTSSCQPETEGSGNSFDPCLANPELCAPGDGDGDGDGDGKGDCTAGQLYCDCDGQKGCVPGLVCHEGDICVPDDCPDGTEGCECSDGTTGCDKGLDCVNGFCIDNEGGACIQPYNECWDYDEQESLGDCCSETLCVGYEPYDVAGCATKCSLHTGCATDCCVSIQDNEDTYCSPTAQFCDEFGKCIDTCAFAEDGACDDGGPDSDYDLCEFGTDCADCGNRD